MSDPDTPEEEPNLPPSPLLSYDEVPYESVLVYCEPLAQHIVSVVVIL